MGINRHTYTMWLGYNWRYYCQVSSISMALPLVIGGVGNQLHEASGVNGRACIPVQYRKIIDRNISKGKMWMNWVCKIKRSLAKNWKNYINSVNWVVINDTIAAGSNCCGNVLFCVFGRPSPSPPMHSMLQLQIEYFAGPSTWCVHVDVSPVILLAIKFEDPAVRVCPNWYFIYALDNPSILSIQFVFLELNRLVDNIFSREYMCVFASCAAWYTSAIRALAYSSNAPYRNFQRNWGTMHTETIIIQSIQGSLELIWLIVHSWRQRNKRKSLFSRLALMKKKHVPLLENYRAIFKKSACEFAMPQMNCQVWIQMENRIIFTKTRDYPKIQVIAFKYIHNLSQTIQQKIGCSLQNVFLWIFGNREVSSRDTIFGANDLGDHYVLCNGHLYKTWTGTATGQAIFVMQTERMNGILFRDRDFFGLTRFCICVCAFVCLSAIFIYSIPLCMLYLQVLLYSIDTVGAGFLFDSVFHHRAFFIGIGLLWSCICFVYNRVSLFGFLFAVCHHFFHE